MRSTTLSLMCNKAMHLSSCQHQRFVNARYGIPEDDQQHLAVQIEHIMQQGAHLGASRYFGSSSCTRAI